MLASGLYSLALSDNWLRESHYLISVNDLVMYGFGSMIGTCQLPYCLLGISSPNILTKGVYCYSFLWVFSSVHITFALIFIFMNDLAFLWISKICYTEKRIKICTYRYINVNKFWISNFLLRGHNMWILWIKVSSKLVTVGKTKPRRRYKSNVFTYSTTVTQLFINGFQIFTPMPHIWFNGVSQKVAKSCTIFNVFNELSHSKMSCKHFLNISWLQFSRSDLTLPFFTNTINVRISCVYWSHKWHLPSLLAYLSASF